MKVKDILAGLKDLDPELDIYASDPDGGCILLDFSKFDIIEVDEELTWRIYPDNGIRKEFPIGFKFVNLK